MTTTYQIIVDAYRQSNLIAIGVEPTQIQETEALRYLNRLVKSVFGDEVGDPLEGFPLGKKGISRPSGYPCCGGVPTNDWFVPKNTRLMVNIDEPLTVYLHPAPEDGTRFGVVDASGDFQTNNLTLVGNGNLVDGIDQIVLDEDRFSGEWVYRQDMANWVQYAPLSLFATFPFPEEFDDYFILMLAFRLNPSYERTLDPQSQTVLQRSRRQLQARYSQVSPTRSELALIRPSVMAADRDQWGNSYWLYNPSDMFTKGWPW